MVQCNNAAKEIVKEEAIYGRAGRAVNLGIFPYLASKFVVLTVITAFQVLVFLVCIHGVLRWRPKRCSACRGPGVCRG